MAKNSLAFLMLRLGMKEKANGLILSAFSQCSNAGLLFVFALLFHPVKLISNRVHFLNYVPES